MAAAQREGPPLTTQLPASPTADGGAWLVLVALAFLAPALGVPGEWMLQDTFKSIVVALCALLAATLLLWARARCAEPLRWNAALWLPSGAGRLCLGERDLVACVAGLGAGRALVGVMQHAGSPVAQMSASNS